MVLVLIMSILIVFLIAGWQSRLLLSLHRSRSLSDILVLTYHTESKIYDIIAKFLGGYPNAFSWPFGPDNETLADGTVITTSGVENGRRQTLTVLARRLFGSTKMEVVREDNSDVNQFFQDMEILLSLDCTESMSNPACDGCVNTRMDEQKTAVLNFLRAVEETEGHERVKIGISVFELQARWLNTQYRTDGTPIGVDVRPDNDLSFLEMRQAVETGFTRWGHTGSPACKKVHDYTSVGSGLTFMHDYLRESKTEGVKQVEVLITDGEPNESILYVTESGPKCYPVVFCPHNIDYCCGGGPLCGDLGWYGWCSDAYVNDENCAIMGRDFLRCALADTNTEWTSEWENRFVLQASYEPSSTPMPSPTLRPTRTPTPFGAPSSTPRPTRTPTPVGWISPTSEPTNTPHPTPAIRGVRDPDVDVYTVTVMESPPPNVMSIFQTYSTHHFNLNEASGLNAILGQILQEIIQSLTSYQIRRVVPTPIR